jgi:hypothetical protein
MKINLSKETVWRNLFLALLAFIPALICLWYINSYATNVLIFDGWHLMASCWTKMEAHQFTFADLFIQHNEHRMIFVIPLYFGLLSVSNFNSIVPMQFSLLMILVIFFIISHYIVIRNGVSDRKKYFFAALISFLLFSLTQEENILWDFAAIQNMGVSLFTILSLYCLHRILQENPARRNLYFVIALISALIATFASIQGLITWITGTIFMALVWRQKSFKTPAFLIWNAVAILTWIAYFYDYVKPEHHPSLSYSLEHPGTFIHYFLALAGNAISGNFKAGVTVAGIALVVFLLIACVKIWKNKQVRQLIFPLALTLNSLFVLGSIAIGRTGFGVEQALSSRYTTFGIHLVVAILLLWMELRDRHKKKTIIKNLTKLLAAMLVLSIPLTMTEGIHRAKGRKIFTDYKAYLLETARMQPIQMLQGLYSAEPDSVLTIAPRMEQKKLSVYHNPSYAVPELLFNDSLATDNNEVLQFVQNTIQFAPDFMVVVRPVVHPKYRSDVKALYADIDGQLFPLYYKPEFNNRPPNPAWENDITAISNRMFTAGVHAIKFKALRHNNAGYYVINPNWVFETK